MTSANLDLVGSIYADWERGDFSSTEWADAAIEYVVVGGLSPGEWTGRDGMANAARDIFMEGWEGIHAVADDYVVLDDTRILVLVTHVARGKRSGIEMAGSQTKTAHLFGVRDGKVTRLVVYWDRDRALADLALGPEIHGTDSR